MANSKTFKIEKLDDASLESISGGGVLSQKAKSNIMYGGEVATAIGLLGYGVCTIASAICKHKNQKAAGYLDTAGNIFGGVAALGGATYLGGKIG